MTHPNSIYQLILLSFISILLFTSAQAASVKADSDKNKTDNCVELIKQKSFYDAIEKCEASAKKSDKISQFALGTLYYQGQGVMQDYSIAFKWIKKAASNNLPIAQYNLGIMIANSQGVEADLVTAVAWLKMAEKNKYSEASAVITQIDKELSKKEREKAELAFKTLLKEITK